MDLLNKAANKLDAEFADSDVGLQPIDGEDVLFLYLGKTLDAARARDAVSGLSVDGQSFVYQAEHSEPPSHLAFTLVDNPRQ